MQQRWSLHSFFFTFLQEIIKNNLLLIYLSLIFCLCICIILSLCLSLSLYFALYHCFFLSHYHWLTDWLSLSLSLSLSLFLSLIPLLSHVRARIEFNLYVDMFNNFWHRQLLPYRPELKGKIRGPSDSEVLRRRRFETLSLSQPVWQDWAIF